VACSQSSTSGAIGVIEGDKEAISKAIHLFTVPEDMVKPSLAYAKEPAKGRPGYTDNEYMMTALPNKKRRSVRIHVGTLAPNIAVRLCISTYLKVDYSKVFVPMDLLAMYTSFDSVLKFKEFSEAAGENDELLVKEIIMALTHMFLTVILSKEFNKRLFTQSPSTIPAFDEMFPNFALLRTPFNPNRNDDNDKRGCVRATTDTAKMVKGDVYVRKKKYPMAHLIHDATELAMHMDDKVGELYEELQSTLEDMYVNFGDPKGVDANVRALYGKQRFRDFMVKAGAALVHFTEVAHALPGDKKALSGTPSRRSVRNAGRGKSPAIVLLDDDEGGVDAAPARTGGTESEDGEEEEENADEEDEEGADADEDEEDAEDGGADANGGSVPATPRRRARHRRRSKAKSVFESSDEDDGEWKSESESSSDEKRRPKPAASATRSTLKRKTERVKKAIKKMASAGGEDEESDTETDEGGLEKRVSKKRKMKRKSSKADDPTPKRRRSNSNKK
jgi:major membrane immunogen (membrane-anchored lipoprotein)